MAIPLVDLKAQYDTLKADIDHAIATVIEETAFVRGRHVAAFEEAFARAVGARHCISCASGTDALFIVLKMLGIGAGDEVITTANSWIATSETISLTGATPVFVDVERDFYCLDPDQVESKITDRTRAILPVHLCGQPAQMDALSRLASRHDLAVVEDCAQAHLAQFSGRNVGLLGRAGAFSFYPGKNLGAYGDAGGIVTDDDELAERCRLFANHGASRQNKYDHQMEGICSRMDGLQAAILSVKLPRLAAWNAARRAAAARYDSLLGELPGVSTPCVRPDSSHVYHVYCIRTARRDGLQQHLQACGIATARHYPTPLPLLTAYRRLGHTPDEFPVACSHAAETLSLPIYPELSEAQQQHVASAIAEFLER